MSQVQEKIQVEERLGDLKEEEKSRGKAAMSRVQDKGDSFCKLILEKEPVQHLTIWPEFSRLYHRELPNTVIFKGPSGNEWPAKLRKDGDFVYVQDDGWQKFHRDNALGNSEFLIFRYDGKNCFKVQVFDPTGVERLNVAGAQNTRTNNPSERRPRGRPRKHPIGSQNLNHQKL
ncbi:hypothetical protein BT93_I1485 [Corymbia citriodora subsp. variegata]|nr:hypothetical protein BT93_I1485 [Corymbia citriodora subsp. variegata]